MLFVVLPMLVSYFRRAPPLSKPPTESDIHHGADRLDILIMRVAVTIESIGYLMFALAPTGTIYTLAGAWISLGGAGSPTVQSALTKHVPNEKTGQLLGALALLHSLCRVVAPTGFNLVYALTVGTQPTMVFVVLASTFSIAFICSWWIRPGVTWHEASRGGGGGGEDGVSG